MEALMLLALALSFTEPSTGILAPLAVRSMVGSPLWYGMFHLLAVAALMMVRVQPVSGVARTWDHPPELSATQRSSAGVLVLALTALASWKIASSSSDSGLSGFSDFDTLALSLRLSFCCRPLSGLDWQAFARCPVCLRLMFNVNLLELAIHSYSYKSITERYHNW